MDIDIEEISLSDNVRKKRWMLDNIGIERDIIYRDIKPEIRIELKGVKVLDVNKRKGLIRVVLMEERDKLLIENIEKKLVELIGSDNKYISCKMNVDGKDILNLGKGDKINCVRGMDIDCEVVIRNVQKVDDKCTCGIILEEYKLKGDMEIYGEILEDEYYV